VLNYFGVPSVMTMASVLQLACMRSMDCVSLRELGSARSTSAGETTRTTVLCECESRIYVYVCVCVWKSSTKLRDGCVGNKLDVVVVMATGLGLSWPCCCQSQSLLCRIAGVNRVIERGKPVPCVFLHVTVCHAI
jgi:hypothetical protein